MYKYLSGVASTACVFIMLAIIQAKKIVVLTPEKLFVAGITLLVIAGLAAIICSIVTLQTKKG
jgi:hypothetical protein